jgi:arylsulfatase B
MDRGIGNILEAIRETGIEENTLIVFMSDNGPDVGSGGGSSGPLRGHKFMEFEGGVRVPSIIRWPAGFEGGRIIEQITGFIDLFPTICDIVTPGKIPAEFDGISILDVLVGNKEYIDRELYLGCGALVENDFKIILAGQNARMKLGNDVLFNLRHDPFEQNDISKMLSDTKVRLIKKVKENDSIIPTMILPPYEEGRQNFLAPAEWNLFPELN